MWTVHRWLYYYLQRNCRDWIHLSSDRTISRVLSSAIMCLGALSFLVGFYAAETVPTSIFQTAEAAYVEQQNYTTLSTLNSAILRKLAINQFALTNEELTLIYLGFALISSIAGIAGSNFCLYKYYTAVITTYICIIFLFSCTCSKLHIHKCDLNGTHLYGRKSINITGVKCCVITIHQSLL